MPVVNIEYFGRQREPLVIIDDFHPDPDALLEQAKSRLFGSSRTHYPGVEAPAPKDALRVRADLLLPILRDTFGLTRERAFTNSMFSMVTTRPEALSLPQRLPHCDSNNPNQLALLHYLNDADTAGGTGFFRHRSTGLECISPAEQAGYFDRLRTELETHPPAQDYVTDSTELYELIGKAEAKWNRLVIYRSYRLHSGLIPKGAVLSPVPGQGRLTVNTFVRGEPGNAAI